MDTLILESSPVITCGNILIVIIKSVRGKTADVSVAAFISWTTFLIRLCKVYLDEEKQNDRGV